MDTFIETFRKVNQMRAEQLQKMLELTQAERSGERHAQTAEETIHDLRVAIRRFQSFFSLLPQRKELSQLETLKQLFDRLGEIRDAQVQLLLLKRIAPENSLSVKIQEQRTVEIKDKIEHFFIYFGENLTDFSAAVDQLERILFAFQPDIESLNHLLQKKEHRALKALKKVRKKNSDENLHDLRIEIKKLRYLCETLGTLEEPESTSLLPVETLKANQDILGEIHDIDILLEQLKKNITGEKEEVKSLEKRLKSERKKFLQKVKPARLEKTLKSLSFSPMSTRDETHSAPAE